MRTLHLSHGGYKIKVSTCYLTFAPFNVEINVAPNLQSFQMYFILFPPFLGVPMEVMGLMLGEFVDEYTVRVIDVFAMPQSGTGVSVEAVDPVFQAKMLDMLKQTGKL